MKYHIKASSISKQEGIIQVKQSTINFGTTSLTSENLPNPAELFLSSFASCILKNVERFSVMLKFNYLKANIEVYAMRLENPPRLDNIRYNLIVYSSDKRLNIDLLKKNIEKFGTIYNTIKLSCTISGTIRNFQNI
ncbi:MAG: OsmC family protein [Polaribacter sp.]|nr:OsmC family protein [Polaribacter sp.]